MNDSFVHTYRSELASAQVNGETYGYDYDNIGNRRMAMEASDYAFYEANNLNQYTSIQRNEEAFEPTFDADGNQTLVRTATGIWSVSYNAENRPVIFQKITDTVTTRIICTYDSIGRRATKKVEEITTDAEGNESVTVISNYRFIYRGYLQIACCDLTRSGHPCLWLITWDPTQPVATRPLAIQKDGTWYTYGWDLTKNICEVFGQNGYIRTTYTYTPYGSVTVTGDITQPIQWSSEYVDSDLALVYYNYRHYNPMDGRWLGKDPIEYTYIYSYVGNNPISSSDEIGLLTVGIDGTSYDIRRHAHQKSNVSRIIGLVKDKTIYQGGPGSHYEWIDIIPEATGSSLVIWDNKINTFAEIRDSLHNRICKEYLKNKSLSINLFGWSRGAVIAVEIAKLLNDKGCCIKRSRTISRSWDPFAEEQFFHRCCLWKKKIPVNFIGLFDPVDMAFININTSIKPDNVKALFSIQSNYPSVKEKVLYRPQKYDGEDRIRLRRNKDNSKTSHGDIGGAEDGKANDALQLMIQKAREAGVNI